jgi:predicted nuclease of restriction endonuclease-like (RecB) superfamily
MPLAQEQAVSTEKREFYRRMTSQNRRQVREKTRQLDYQLFTQSSIHQKSHQC